MSTHKCIILARLIEATTTNQIPELKNRIKPTGSNDVPVCKINSNAPKYVRRNDQPREKRLECFRCANKT